MSIFFYAMAVIFMLALIVVIGIMALGMHYLWVVLPVLDKPMTPNDNSQAIAKPMELVSQASNLIEIYDDGDSSPESIYNNSEFIDLVKKKLDESPDLTVNVLFRFDESLKFKEEFRNHVRVDIRVNGGQEGAYHYKIIDGSFIYLTEHEPRSHNRRFKVVEKSEIGRLPMAVTCWQIRQNKNSFTRI